jgi:hypothetical protein
MVFWSCCLFSFLCYSRLKLFRWLLNISVKSSSDTHRQWQKACVNPLTNSAKMCPKSEEHLYSVQRLTRGDGNSSDLVWKSNWKYGQGSTLGSPTPLPPCEFENLIGVCRQIWCIDRSAKGCILVTMFSAFLRLEPHELDTNTGAAVEVCTTSNTIQGRYLFAALTIYHLWLQSLSKKTQGQPSGNCDAAHGQHCKQSLKVYP